MHKSFILFLVALLSAPFLSASPIVFSLWPNGAPTSNGLQGEEIVYPDHVSNVTQPVLAVYLPASPNGQAVLALPGGGYVDVWDGTEGHNLAEWYNAQGITYAVLKYRLPNGHPEVPFDDARKAMRILRAHAAEWHLQQIGIQGCSAGGHLAATLACCYTAPEERPDFQILLYPCITMDPQYMPQWLIDYLLGPDAPAALRHQYSMEQRVTASTPPAIMLLSIDDGLVPIQNSQLYTQALRQHGISARCYFLPSGGHGWCGHLDFPYRSIWMQTLSSWLTALRP